MTISGRRGHWRTNGAGMRFWVKEHSVERVNYTLSKKGAESFVNDERLLETRCKYCYEKVFYFTNKNHQNVVFNKNLETLTIHNCRKNTEIQKEKTPLNLPKKFLDENDAKALDRRAEELNERLKTSGSRKPTEIPGYYDRNLKQIYSYLVRNKHSFKKLKVALENTPFLEMYPDIINTALKEILKVKEAYKGVPLSAKAYKKKVRDVKFLYQNLTQLTESSKSMKVYGKGHLVKLLELRSQLGRAIHDLDSFRVSWFEEKQRAKARERSLKLGRSKSKKTQNVSTKKLQKSELDVVSEQQPKICICATCGKNKTQDRFKKCATCRKEEKKLTLAERKVPIEIRRKNIKAKNKKF